MLQGLTSQEDFQWGLKSLLIANLIDAFFTIYWVKIVHIAIEANPLMALTLTYGPGLFLWTKVLFVIGFVWLLNKYKHLYWVRLILIPVCLIYALVVGWHLGFLIKFLL